MSAPDGEPLAKVAIEDNFGEQVARLRGTVSKDANLEF
jgi:hypothetical protein